MFRPPTWLVYPLAVLGLLTLALRSREHADAPPAPPPLTAGEGQVLAQTAPIDPLLVVKVRARSGLDAATAFSVADNGVWLTSVLALARCAHPAILVSDTEGVDARAGPVTDGAVVLTTGAGAPALPLASSLPHRGALAYAAGYVRGRPAEVALRYLGEDTVRARTRQSPDRTFLVWAEAGRTQGLSGALDGFDGAPALDGEGRVVGVIVGEAPRRGRLYSTTPDDVARAFVSAKVKRATPAAGVALTRDNYGLAADDLRRALRIAPLACVSQ